MCKWFCENIGYLEIGTNTGQFDVSTEALVTHKVVKFSNMLHRGTSKTAKMAQNNPKTANGPKRALY